MDSQVVNKKNIATLLLLLLLVVTIPIGINLLKQQQNKSRAATTATSEIKFFGEGVTCDNSGGNCTTTNSKVDIVLQAPWPANVTLTSTPTPTLVP